LYPGTYVQWQHTEKSTMDGDFAIIPIGFGDLGVNGTNYIWCQSRTLFGFQEGLFYIALNTTPKATNIGYISGRNYFFGATYGDSNGDTQGHWPRLLAGNYEVGFFAYCPLVSCYHSLSVQLHCYLLNATGAPIPPMLTDNRMTAYFTVTPKGWQYFRLNLTGIPYPNGRNKHTVYFNLDMSFWTSDTVVSYLGKNGTQPTIFEGHYAEKYPVGIPIPGPYTFAWELQREVYWMGVYGYFVPKGLDVFTKPTAEFQIQIGINHYPGDGAASLTPNLFLASTLLLLLLTFSFLS